MALSVRIQKKLGAFSLDVDFETDGSALGVLGASGCGKSVTLHCIAGILKPDAGRIVLNGRVLFDSERHIDLPPQKRNIGYLFQQYALFPNMTVRQNIYAGVRTGSRAEKREKVDRALKAFRLEDAAKQYPHTLSGGQKQRTALARILVGNPELLLLDEPFSALDGFLKWQLMQELTDALQTFSGDLLFVTHDRDEIERLCKRVCVLDGGQSEPVTETQTLLIAPKTIAAARLAGFKNIAKAERIASDLADCPAWGWTLPCPKDQPFAAVCVPEGALHVGGDGAQKAESRGILTDRGKRLLLLHPVGAAPDALLGMAWEGEAPSGTLSVAVSQKTLLWLQETKPNDLQNSYTKMPKPML